MKSKKITSLNPYVTSINQKYVIAKDYNNLYDDFIANIPSDGTLKADTISEYTTGAGVTIEGVHIMDGVVEGVFSGDTTLDFTSSTPAYSVYTTATTGGRNHPFFKIGSWDDPLLMTLASDHYVPFQVSLKNSGNVAFDVAAARLRVDTGATNATTAVGCLQLRQNLAHNVASSAILNASVNVSAPVTVGTGSLLGGYFSIEGSGAITKAGSNDCSVLVAVNNNTGSTTVDNVFVALQNGTGRTVTEIIKVDVTNGTATTGIKVANSAGTLGTGIAVSGASTVAMALSGGTGAQLTIAPTGGAHGFSVTGTSQTENDLCEIIAATAVTSSALMKALNVAMTTTGASGTNMIEVARFTLSSAVENGVWSNAVCGKIDFTTTGFSHGLAGVICAELDMPSTNPTGGQGTYTCFEAELGIPTTCTGVAAATSFMNMNVWGISGSAGVDAFIDSGYIFDINGLGSPASSHIIQANTDQATHALRIRIDGTPYFLLMTTVNNGTE